MGVVSRIATSADVMSGMMARMNKVAVDPRAVATEAHARKLREMVLRCAACPDQPGCIALQSTTLTLAEAPDFCPNKEALQALADRT